MTFGIGPAGTGKSYLAVALAVQALQAHQVSKIILTRPAVEAGERLGFLPGDLMAKVDPYLRPLYDALNDLLEPEGAQRLIERGAVEVAPLAFMRGRTLNSSFIILDEAQNTSPEQMKMFLTRIGFGSKAVITGDITQIDIPGGRSGLVGLEPVLTGVEAWPSCTSPGGRGPAPDRRRHRRRLRAGGAGAVPVTGSERPAAGERCTPDHAADEHRPVPSPLARSALGREAVPGRGAGDDGGVAALRRRAHHRLPQRAVPRQGGPHRRAVVPHRGRGGAQRSLARRGGHGPGSRARRPTTAPPPRRRGDLPGGGGPQRRRPRGDLDDELALLVVHGILHLLGMDHEVDAEAEVMERREQQLLDRFYRVDP